MGPLLMALLPVIEGLIAHEAIGTIFAGLTEAQWVTLASDILNIAEPQLAAGLTAKLKALRPEVDTFLTDIEGGKSVESAAASVFFSFAPFRPAPTIPGYAGDGGVKDIPNPDYKQGE